MDLAARVSGAEYRPAHDRLLYPDGQLAVHLRAIMCRNQYTHDPAPVIAELYGTAGDRIDILTAEVGRWVGFYEDDYTRDLSAALRALRSIWMTRLLSASRGLTRGIPSEDTYRLPEYESGERKDDLSGFGTEHDQYAISFRVMSGDTASTVVPARAEKTANRPH